MYKYMFLIILSLGIHSHFVPLKISTSHLQHKNIHTLVNEIVSLLNKISENVKGIFTAPVNITSQSCSHEYTETFIRELTEAPGFERVLLDMEELKNLCPFLKKKGRENHHNCEIMETDFSTFKEKLECFVCWINEKNICNTTQDNGQRLYIPPQYSCADEKNY